MKITDSIQKDILAKKISAIEETLGITGKELSRICEVSDVTIYRLEGRTATNKAGISEKLLRKICQKTAIKYDWLVDFSSETTLMPKWEDENDYINAKNEGSAAERIKELRRKIPCSQKQFAESLSIKPGSVSAIETGRIRLTKQLAKEIESIYGRGVDSSVSDTPGSIGAGADWLLTGDEQNRYFPAGEKMMEWLRKHQDVREQIWKWMAEETNESSGLSA